MSEIEKAVIKLSTMAEHQQKSMDKLVVTLDNVIKVETILSEVQKDVAEIKEKHSKLGDRFYNFKDEQAKIINDEIKAVERDGLKMTKWLLSIASTAIIIGSSFFYNEISTLKEQLNTIAIHYEKSKDK